MLLTDDRAIATACGVTSATLPDSPAANAKALVLLPAGQLQSWPPTDDHGVAVLPPKKQGKEGAPDVR